MSEVVCKPAFTVRFSVIPLETFIEVSGTGITTPEKATRGPPKLAVARVSFLSKGITVLTGAQAVDRKKMLIMRNFRSFMKCNICCKIIDKFQILYD
jgi:hypothetical protein